MNNTFYFFSIACLFCHVFSFQSTRVTISRKVRQQETNNNLPANTKQQQQRERILLFSSQNKPIFNGGEAGLDADENCVWDEETMSGPLGKFLDGIFLERFRTALAASNLKQSSDYAPGYNGMMDMIREIMETAPNAEHVVAKSRATLNSLFPDWPPNVWNDRVGLLFWFEILFAKPFPIFSSKLNAWVTWLAAQWLMGPCDLKDLEEATVSSSLTENGQRIEEDIVIKDSSNQEIDTMLGDGKDQLVLVRRCRYLEAGACASLCVNSCKLPTQQFFNEDMGVPMRMIPDYSTYECRFEFGMAPTPEDEEEARNVSCFAQCTSPKKRADGERMVACGK